MVSAEPQRLIAAKCLLLNQFQTTIQSQFQLKLHAETRRADFSIPVPQTRTSFPEARRSLEKNHCASVVFTTNTQCNAHTSKEFASAVSERPSLHRSVYK